jgi:hypothetical protein
MLDYYSTSTAYPSYKALLQHFRKNSSITLAKKISKFSILNQITKALKLKYKKYMLFGEMRLIVPKILDIALRYMENYGHLKCEACQRFVKFRRSEGNKLDKFGLRKRVEVEYPVLNHGNHFYHEECCPDSIKYKVM